VVGSTVYNEANETVGTIDDLIVTPNERVPFAVLSVGGFLGMGTKYVVVPFSSLVVKDKKMVVPGATKDSLKSLPEFKYSPWAIVRSRVRLRFPRRACKNPDTTARPVPEDPVAAATNVAGSAAVVTSEPCNRSTING
jgi:hypothetical protein